MAVVPGQAEEGAQAQAPGVRVGGREPVLGREEGRRLACREPLVGALPVKRKSKGKITKNFKRMLESIKPKAQSPFRCGAPRPGHWSCSDLTKFTQG